MIINPDIEYTFALSVVGFQGFIILINDFNQITWIIILIIVVQENPLFAFETPEDIIP
jgi:hypothetical protein